MDRQHTSFVLGARLKALREERGLSHVDLIKQLNEKYGISVSRDSVMAYEISDETRAKASKLPNMGMRVETLYCLADFYGVSLDYLLGKTTVKAADCNMQYMSGYTGLSEQTLEILHQEASSSKQETGDVLCWPNCIAILINTIFSSGNWSRLYTCLLTSVQMQTIESRFWAKKIEGYSTMSPRERYTTREQWKRREQWKTVDFNDEIFNKIVDPDLLTTVPVWTVASSQDYALDNIFYTVRRLAKDKCVEILESRINTIETWEKENASGAAEK